MSRSQYYEEMKRLAREVREEFGLETPRVLRADLRCIYRKHHIKIDLWPATEGQPCKLRKLRGAYFNDEMGSTVMINRQLPQDPRIFTMAHELKHHLVDRDIAVSYCGRDNENIPIEIAAEVFAAELIFPENDFADRLIQMGVGYGKCTPEDLARLKCETKTTLSYAGLEKRAVFMRFAVKGSFAGVQWKKLEEQIYGEPLYKLLQRRRGL